MSYCVVMVTAKNKAQAIKIAKGVLEAKVAACVNIIDAIQSMFWWEGKIDSSQEALLIIKTKKSCFQKLVRTVKSLHSYSTPEIIALPIQHGDASYLKWISTLVK